METPRNGSRVAKKTEYYYDLPSGSLLVGRVALDAFIESGGHPADIRELGAYINSEEEIISPIPPHPGFQETPQSKGWTLEDYTTYGHWLTALVEPHRGPKETSLNKRIINRARDIGLGPGINPIITRFGNLGKYYSVSEIKGTRRIGAFDSWTSQDFVKHIASIGKKLGRRPTRDDIRQQHRKNPLNPPSEIIYERFRHNGGLRRALELAGYISVELWEDQDYIDWGANFIKANDGRIPTARDLLYCSANGIGPSSRGVMNKFGSMRAYQGLAENAFIEKETAQKEQNERMLMEIQRRISVGMLPSELFEDTLEQHEMIKVFARYMVSDAFMSESMIVAKLSIANETNDSYEGAAGLIRGIKKRFPHVGVGDIESTALYLGVYSYIFDDESETMKKLKLPETARRRRQERKVTYQPD
jgi:hypothetical protein